MGQHPGIPETDEDRAVLRRLLARAADPWSRIEDLAGSLGVARSAVSQYLSGARGVGWHVVVGALRRTARRHPEAVAGLVEALALELIDVRGRWVPDEEGPTGSWTEEAADVVVAIGDVHRAVERGYAVAVTRLARLLEREAREAARAAVGAA